MSGSARDDEPKLLPDAGLSRSLADELTEIALHSARRTVISDTPADEIFGYDDRGIPTR